MDVITAEKEDSLMDGVVVGWDDDGARRSSSRKCSIILLAWLIESLQLIYPVNLLDAGT
jgi:hypothetical protein